MYKCLKKNIKMKTKKLTGFIIILFQHQVSSRSSSKKSINSFYETTVCPLCRFSVEKMSISSIIPKHPN